MKTNCLRRLWKLPGVQALFQGQIPDLSQPHHLYRLVCFTNMSDDWAVGFPLSYAVYTPNSPMAMSARGMGCYLSLPSLHLTSR